MDKDLYHLPPEEHTIQVYAVAGAVESTGHADTTGTPEPEKPPAPVVQSATGHYPGTIVVQWQPVNTQFGASVNYTATASAKTCIRGCPRSGAPKTAVRAPTAATSVAPCGPKSSSALKIMTNDGGITARCLLVVC